MALVAQHLTESRPRFADTPAKSRSSKPLDALVDRMMSKKPDDRYAAYADLVAAMEALSPQISRPAGFWARGFALALDAFLLALVANALESLLPFGGGGAWFLGLAAVYGVVAHGRWGRTLGKAALEIEVICADGVGRPGYRRALIRFIVQWLPVYVGSLLSSFAALTVSTNDNVVNITANAITAVAVARLPIEGLVAAVRDPQKRTSWDRLSRTQTRYLRSGASQDEHRPSDSLATTAV
jgi:hypothetical protein